MNHCGFKGYLVNGDGVVPDDPTDLGVEWLPIVGRHFNRGFPALFGVE